MIRLGVDAAALMLHGEGRSIACVIGRGGLCEPADKHEGDGCTPRGEWALRGVMLRTDRVAPAAGIALPWRRIARDDGWSDDPADPAYNRPVRHPHRFSAERLWRDDGA